MTFFRYLVLLRSAFDTECTSMSRKYVAVILDWT